MNWIIVWSDKKILSWVLREAIGILKAAVVNRVQPDHHFIRIVFSSQSLVFSGRLCLKASQHILDISQAEV